MQYTAISTRGLGRAFGPVEAVRSLDLTVQRGEFFGLVGPDGAGKSTTIRLLCGLLKPTAGEGHVLGFDLNRDSEALKSHIGYLSQSFTLYGDLTVDENIEFFADLHGVDSFERRRDELLAFTRLAPFRRRLSQNLSGGMKKKLALACAMIHTPDILFLDEPSTGVDPVSRGEFRSILDELLARGVTIIMTTPYLDEAERCRRIGMMHRGTLVRLGAPDTIRAEFSGQLYNVTGIALGPAHALLRRRWPPSALVRYGDRLHFFAARGPGDPAEAAAWLVANGIAGVRFTPVEPSLEDVFVALMSEPHGEEKP